MNRTLRTSLITSSVLAFAVLGCNSLLDNQPGVAIAVDEGGTVTDPGTVPTAPTDPQTPPATDGGATDADAGEVLSPGCPAGKRMCFGTCVSVTDPVYGCGDPSCSPCKSTRSTMACQGGKCAVTACDPGYSNCNANPADGCETDLSKATSCGSCNAVCAPAAPNCAPAGPKFQCTTGCTPDAPVLCGAQCVDPNTSTSHCGACNVTCPLVDNGIAACAGGACNFTCKPQFHACVDKCVANADPATCGPTCTPCPVPPGGVATCVNDVCGVQCPATARACGGKCVAKTDPTACGVACTACPVPAGGTATCVNDACGTQCPATARLCAGACVARTDPTACGAACTVCPVPPNAAATCAADACNFACSPGFGNCDMNAVNGCETDLVTNPAHCGMCGKVCAAGQACVNSVCVAP